MRRGVALLAITAITAAGCGSDDTVARRPPATTITAHGEPAVEEVTLDDLVPATFDECAEAGVAIANYLLTGETDDPQVEQHFAAERANLLARPAAARAGLARAAASDLIVRCDDQFQAEADAAEAAREADRLAAEEAAKAEAEWQAYRAQAQATCTAAGGAFEADENWHTVECLVTYGDREFHIVFDPTGDVDLGSAEYEQGICDLETGNAARDREMGYPWPREPQFHPESGLCDPGDPY